MVGHQQQVQADVHGDVLQAEPVAGVETCRDRGQGDLQAEPAARRGRQNEPGTPGRRAVTRSWRRDGASYLTAKTETGAC